MKKHVFYFNLLQIKGMKGMKILMVMLAMWCAVGAWGQGWLRVIEALPGSLASGYEGPMAVPTNDNEIMIVVPYYGSNSVQIIRTDNNGNPIFERLIDSILIFGIRPLDDGNFIAVGRVGNQSTGKDLGCIAKMDKYGNIIWRKVYEFQAASDNYFYGVEFSPDGGYVITFISLGIITKNYGLLKTNSTGELQWWRDFSPIVPNVFNLRGGLTISADSNAYAVSANINDGDDSIIVVKTNLVGEVLWQKGINGPASSYISTAGIAPSDDGGFIVGGMYLNGAVPMCCKIDGNGNIAWLKAWNTSIGGGYIFDIIKTFNGNYWMIGSANPLQSSDYLMIQFDDTGQEISFRKIGTLQNETATRIVQLQDSSLLICGTGMSNNSMSTIVIARTTSQGILYSSALTGQLHQDLQSDCLPDPDEPGLAGWLVQADGAQSFATLTDSLGHFLLPVDTGSYSVTVAPPGPYWEVCNSPYQVAITEFYDTLSLDFPAQTISDCPYLTVDISAPFLRRCFDNNYYVQYCNDGTITAEDATVEVTLDPNFTYVSSSIPPASQNGNTLTFDVGDVAVNDCGSFHITAYLSCDSTVLGQTHCTSAHISPDSLCPPLPDPLWDGSSIETEVSCNGDSVTFTITNVGTGDMPAPLSYIIIEDEIVLMSEDFQLPAGQSTTITLPASGTTLHLEAQQAAEHPSGFASTGATIEGCGGWLSLGLFGQWAFDDDPDPFTDVDCQANIGSFDPNDKQGFPAGLGDEHLIELEQDIEYLIRFQNTGTDTAFKVTIVDVLPTELDLASIRPGASSHPYTYGVTPEGWLTFTFDDIMLPDSNVNEAASHGFVRFRASQTAGLGHGDYIENTALIYFDFNAPVQTNTYRHRIGQVNPWTLVGTTPPVFLAKKQVRIVPNPLTDSALLQVEGIELGPLNLVLTDVSGKILRQQTTQGTGFEFQRGELAPGVYFFQIERNGERVGSGKLMVR